MSHNHFGEDSGKYLGQYISKFFFNSTNSSYKRQTRPEICVYYIKYFISKKNYLIFKSNSNYLLLAIQSTLDIVTTAWINKCIFVKYQY